MISPLDLSCAACCAVWRATVCLQLPRTTRMVTILIGVLYLQDDAVADVEVRTATAQRTRVLRSAVPTTGRASHRHDKCTVHTVQYTQYSTVHLAYLRCALRVPAACGLKCVCCYVATYLPPAAALHGDDSICADQNTQKSQPHQDRHR